MPNEQEIMDAAIILYSLQCLSSVVHFGGDVQKYVVSSEERDLLFSILTENLSPDGRKKAEMIRRLAGQFPPK